MTANIPTHPQPSIFNETLAATGIDYFRIVARTKWSPPHFDVALAWRKVERRHAQQATTKGRRSKVASRTPKAGAR